MSKRGNPSQRNDDPTPAEIYHRMMVEISHTARGWKNEQYQPEDLWDAAFRDGFFQTLSKNPGLAFEFLRVTDRGPTWHYQKYLNMIEDNDDLLALIALSALVNDALH